MFGLDTLDVAIGLTLFFLIVSLICSSIREALEGILKLRARNLERGMRELLDDPTGETLARSIYEHGQVYSLFAGSYDAARLSWKKSDLLTHPLGGLSKWWAGRNLPSYVPSGQFASALMDVVARGPTSAYPSPPGPITLAQLRDRVSDLPSPRVQRAVLAAIDHAEGDLEKAKANIELWFDGSMDRVSGWYKRSTQLWLFAIGLAAAILMNLDALTVAHRLSEDKTLREAFLAQAQAYTAPVPAKTGGGDVGNATEATGNRSADTGNSAGGSSVGGAETANGTTPSGEGGRGANGGARAALPAKSVEALRADLAAMGSPTGWVEVDRVEKVKKDGKETQEHHVHRYPGPQYQAWCGPASRRCDGAPPFGWWLPILLGWLVTAVAVTFGAPFWFDILNKFMVVRATVKPREKSREEGSEDRSPRTGGGGPSGGNDGNGGNGGDGRNGTDGGGGVPPPPTPPPPPPPPDPAEQGFEPEEWAQGRQNPNEIKL